MTTLHMQTETAHSTARQMEQTAAQVEAHLQSLLRVVHELESNWQGGSSSEFAAEAQDLTRRLKSHNDLLHVLAGRLEREVTEWQEVDQRGAMTMREGGSKFAYALSTQGLPWVAGMEQKYGSSFPALQIAPVTTALSIGAFIQGLPIWFSSVLDRFFAEPQIISPIVEEAAIPPINDTTSAPSSGFGELLQEPPPAAPAVETAPQTTYDQYYDVPVKSQGNLYGNAACAPTSVSMVLDYFHAQNPDLPTATPNDLIGMLDKGDGTPGSGVGLHNMNDDLGQLGYNNITVKVEAGFDDLSSALNDGPVIVTTGVDLVGGEARDVTGPGSVIHAMVVKGLNAESVVINDPWSGVEKVFSRETFQQMWSNGQNGLYAIRP